MGKSVAWPVARLSGFLPVWAVLCCRTSWLHRGSRVLVVVMQPSRCCTSSICCPAANRCWLGSTSARQPHTNWLVILVHLAELHGIVGIWGAQGRSHRQQAKVSACGYDLCHCTFRKAVFSFLEFMSLFRLGSFQIYDSAGLSVSITFMICCRTPLPMRQIVCDLPLVNQDCLHC